MIHDRTEAVMVHGGDVESYRGQYGGDIIDFSSNINPLGPPAGLKKEMDKAYSELSSYPDIRYRELKANIAAYLKCDAREVIVGNGAVDIINTVSAMFRRAVVFIPCFTEYGKRPAMLGREVIRLPFGDFFAIDPERLADILQSNDLLILGNPNNPTGLRIPEKTLMRIHDVVLRKNAFLLLDEAFFEFCPPDYDSVEQFKGSNRVCVIRAATKFFALPGIRLGYGFTSAEFAEKYRNTENPWSVNSYANAAGRCIFRDKDYIERTREYIRKEREYLFHELSEIRWLRPCRSDANFILIKLTGQDEDTVFDRLIRNGILIRKASSFEGLNRGFIRIAVKDHDSNEKLIKLFREFP